jgi:pimeloyl-ACP methyl ester carboxylesterase
MDNATAAALQKAYQLIQAGKQQEAQAILVPIVRENKNIAEAWYLLGFAFSDSEKRLYAFQQVVRIDPSNQPAQKQIDRLLAPQPAPEKPAGDVPARAEKSTSPFTVMPDLDTTAAPESAYIPEPVPGPAPQPAFEPEPSANPKPDAKQAPKKKRRSALGWVLAGIVILIIGFAGIGIWVISGAGLAGSLPFLAAPTVFVPSPTPVASAVPSPSPTPVYTAVFRGTACPFDVPLGTRIRCGVVRVPQDREKNFTDLIELPVVIYQSANPDADVVMFLQGGPGVESIDMSVALFEDYVSPILQEHDMVFFDPRGTGRSKPALDCPDLNQAFMDAYFQNRSQDEAFKDFSATWSKCHERFVAEGIDPAAFNTSQSAADVRDIVKALGYQKVNLLGISYGTRLGLTVMRNYPEIVQPPCSRCPVRLEQSLH